MKKLLIISPISFHNKIGQAGHKTLNYYTSKFENDFDVTVLSLADTWNDDFRLMVKDHPTAKFIGDYKKKTKIQSLIDYMLFNHLYPKLKLISPKYYISNGFHKRRLKRILNSTENLSQFDYVLLEFTPMIFQVDLLKQYLPNVKFVASCVDVTFLSVERWLNQFSCKYYKQMYLSKFKNLEIKAISKCDLIVTQNEKDLLLLKNEINDESKLHAFQPYYDHYHYNPTSPDGIMFFGAIGRKENMESVKWFLSHVWAKIEQSESKTLKFYIVGGGITNEFKKYCKSYHNVIITGFVNDPTEYFNKSVAMVVPLIYGAGIKVKSIEAMASGIPLISNEIGIEGIPVKRGKEYIYCESSKDWLDAINLVVSNKSIRDSLSRNEQNFVKEQFDLEKSYTDYKDRINKLRVGHEVFNYYSTI